MGDTPMTAEEIELYDRMRRRLYRQLVALGGVIVDHGGQKQPPIPWIPTRELVPKGVNLELARLSDEAPSLDAPGDNVLSALSATEKLGNSELLPSIKEKLDEYDKV